MNITEKLDQLAELQAEIDANNLMFKDLAEAALPAEVAEKLADIDAERTSKIEPLQGAATKLTAEIKAEVLAGGVTVKSAHLQAVYAKGRETADVKALKGYAAAHPEASQFIKTGEPSVSIRNI